MARVVYFGTPAFAVPALRALSGSPEIEVTLAVTRPGRPAGRGQRLQPSDVATAAGDLGITIFAPENLRTTDVRDRLAAERADLFVVAAYGQIFGPKILALPSMACLNLHASLLPRYRGASPIAAAIVAGDLVTGVSLMVMGEGLDTGPVIDTVTVPIPAGATTGSLTTVLAVAAGRLAMASIPRFLTGELGPHPQGAGATLTRPMVKADGWLDWSRPAVDLAAQVRAMWPWPRAWTIVIRDGLPVVVQIHAATPVPAETSLAPGTVTVSAGTPAVATGTGHMRLDIVQFPGEGPRSGEAAVFAGRLRAGMIIGLDHDGPPERLPLTVPVNC